MLKHLAAFGKRRISRPLLSRQDLANGGGLVRFLDYGEGLADDVFWQTAGSQLPRDAKPASPFDRGGRADMRGRDAPIVEQAGRGQILNEGIDRIRLVLALDKFLAKL